MNLNGEIDEYDRVGYCKALLQDRTTASTINDPSWLHQPSLRHVGMQRGNWLSILVYGKPTKGANRYTIARFSVFQPELYQR
jgi:hypothetical protein